MKRSLLITFLLLLLLPHASQAQTPVAIEGLEVIAERQYAGNADGTIDMSSEEVFLVSARVYLFSSADNADSTWETLLAAEAVAADLPEEDDSVTYEKTDVDDVGDRAVVMNLSAELSEDETGVFRTMIIQDGTMIVTVTAIAGSVEAAEAADDIATAMIAREPSDDESVYDGNGGSTGGVWDVFLPAEAEELGELHSYADKETRPA